MRLRKGWFVAASAALVVSACTSSSVGSKPVQKSGGEWFQARPLIMPGQHATGTARADPFGALDLPATEDAFGALSPAQQARIANDLHGVDCAHPPQLSGSSDRVVCDAESDVFLLGAPLFSGNDITRATALPPSESVADWQLSITLIAPAAAKMYRWTTVHHVLAQSGVFDDVQTSAQPPCGPIMPTRCSDFTAYVSESTVVTVPVTFAAVQNTVNVVGVPNRAVARQLARKLSS
jgi:hypothetical protein